MIKKLIFEYLLYLYQTFSQNETVALRIPSRLSPLLEQSVLLLPTDSSIGAIGKKKKKSRNKSQFTFPSCVDPTVVVVLVGARIYIANNG